MKKTVLRYGLYSAITICVLFLSSWYLAGNLDYSTQEVIGYTSMIISLCFVFFGIKHFRDKENKGLVSFGKALKIGLLISLIAALAFGLLDVIYVKVINPEFATEYYDYYIEQTKLNTPASDLAAELEKIEGQKELFGNPLMSFLIMGMTVFVIGVIISLLSSVILQRKQP